MFIQISLPLGMKRDTACSKWELPKILIAEIILLLANFGILVLKSNNLLKRPKLWLLKIRELIFLAPKIQRNGH
jgi:hypothetical protein